MDILKIKLKCDLFLLSLKYIKDKKIDEDEFTKWIETKINNHVDKNNISFSEKKRIDEKKCSARVWNNGCEKQCTHSIVKNGYCKKHNTMINEEGVLRFGDIKEKKPKYDLIKLKNKEIEKLYWINPDPLQQLDIVLDNHKRKVILASKHLLVD